MAASRRYTAFLPDWDCQLMVSLSYVDPDLSADRPLYPCVRSDCACAGVFYNSYGGSSSKLRVRVWIETAASARLPNSKLASAVDKAVAGDLDDFFKSRGPEVTMFQGGASNPSEVVSTSENRKWIPNPAALGGGTWEVCFRPAKITGDNNLAQLKISVGVNEVWSAGFEVRTKPSEWLLLQNLPVSWNADTEANVRALLQCCTQDAPKAIVARADPNCALPAGAGAAAPVPQSRVAFVKFQNRVKACGALVGFKALLRRAAGGKSKSKSKSKSKVAASHALASAPVGFENVSVSLAASLNRMYGDDATLSCAVVPPCVVAEMVQAQGRPQSLPACNRRSNNKKRAAQQPLIATVDIGAGAGAGAGAGSAASAPVSSVASAADLDSPTSKRVRVASPAPADDFSEFDAAALPELFSAPSPSFDVAAAAAALAPVSAVTAASVSLASDCSCSEYSDSDDSDCSDYSDDDCDDDHHSAANARVIEPVLPLPLHSRTAPTAAALAPVALAPVLKPLSVSASVASAPAAPPSPLFAVHADEALPSPLTALALSRSSPLRALTQSQRDDDDDDALFEAFLNGAPLLSL